jgi:hypothetical protein
MVSEMLIVGVVNDCWSLTTYIQLIAEEYVISEVVVPGDLLLGEETANQV